MNTLFNNYNIIIWPMCMNTVFNNYNIITMAHVHEYIA